MFTFPCLNEQISKSRVLNTAVTARGLIVSRLAKLKCFSITVEIGSTQAPSQAPSRDKPSPVSITINFP